MIDGLICLCIIHASISHPFYPCSGVQTPEQDRQHLPEQPLQQRAAPIRPRRGGEQQQPLRGLARQLVVRAGEAASAGLDLHPQRLPPLPVQPGPPGPLRPLPRRGRDRHGDEVGAAGE